MKNLKIFFLLFFCMQFFILNGQVTSDSIKESKWHHSISLEGQLHNNYLYQSMEKKYNLFTNYLGGDTINESKPQPRYLFLLTSQLDKIIFFGGVAFNKQKFIYTLPDSPNVDYKYYHFNYKILELPIGIGFSKKGRKLESSYWLGFNTEIILAETRNYSNSIKDSKTGLEYYKLNLFDLSASLGCSLSYSIITNFELFCSISAKASLFPVSYRITIAEIWLNYSSFNLGLGLKYNIS